MSAGPPGCVSRDLVLARDSSVHLEPQLLHRQPARPSPAEKPLFLLEPLLSAHRAVCALLGWSGVPSLLLTSLPPSGLFRQVGSPSQALAWPCLLPLLFTLHGYVLPLARLPSGLRGLHSPSCWHSAAFYSLPRDVSLRGWVLSLQQIHFDQPAAPAQGIRQADRPLFLSCLECRGPFHASVLGHL